MASLIIRRQPPVSIMGPGFSKGGRNASRSQQVGSLQAGSVAPYLYTNQTRGNVSIVGAFQDDDMVMSTGRMGAAWVPIWVVRNQLARGANFSVPAPPFGRATIASGVASFDITTPTGFGDNPVTDPTFKGYNWRFAGCTIDIATSNNVPPGQIDVRLRGFFEDASQYDQTISFLPGHMGLSRYYVLFTRETQGGPYPELLQVSNNLLAADPGVSIVGTSGGDAFEFTPTNGIRSSAVNFSLNASGPDGTVVRAELLDPVSQQWDWVLSEVQADIATAQAMVAGSAAL